MKLVFETWLDSKKLSEKSRHLFNESFICYKVGAYRGSFLFSYLGFLTIMKERIINSTKPSNIDLESWKQTLKNIRPEEKWETVVAETLKNNQSLIELL